MTDKRDDLDQRLAAAIRATPPLPERARFADQVMQRVQQAEREAPRRSWQLAAPLPWWIQAAADPASALACALLALLLWRPDAVTALTRLFSQLQGLLAWPVVAHARSALELDRPAIALGLGILVSLLVGWASFHLYQWTERLARRATRIRS